METLPFGMEMRIGLSFSIPDASAVSHSIPAEVARSPFAVAAFLACEP